MNIPTCPACAHPLTPDDEHICPDCGGLGSRVATCCPHDEATLEDCKACAPLKVAPCDCPRCASQGSWSECPACGWRGVWILRYLGGLEAMPINGEN